MAQVGKVNQLDLGNLIAPADKSSTIKDSAFSSIMSSNLKNTKDGSYTNVCNDSAQTAKAKLEEGSAGAKKIEQCNTKDVSNQVQETVEQVDTVDANEVLAEVAEAVNVLKEKIADVLGITEEELEKLMAESGFNVMNLFQPEVLQQLVLQVNGTSEATDLLTNETMCSQLQELLETVEDFTGLVDMEQLQAIVETDQSFSSMMDEQPLEKIEPTAERTSLEDQEQVITVQKEVASTDDKSEQRKDSSSKNSDNPLGTFQQFVQNLTDSVAGTGEVVAENVEKMQQMQEIVNQVVEKIKVTLSYDTTSMEMQLNPENLGKVNVSIISKNGEMTAAFTVENQIAKEALESQMTTLKDNLQEQGIKVEAIEVTVAQHGLAQDEFSQQNQQQFQDRKKQNSSGSRIRLQGEDSMDEEPEEEIASITNSNGTVDFSA